MVPILTTATLLASYRRSPRHWWEYLDAIEQALEQAAPLPEETVPAVLLWFRCNYAIKTQKAESAPSARNTTPVTRSLPPSADWEEDLRSGSSI